MEASALLHRFAGKRVLLLQGPVGPFFARLAEALRARGATVYKVNFNGGDWVFYPRQSFHYRGTLTDWPSELEHLVATLRIQAVVLFGDCRPVHVPAHRIARNLGVEVWAFEEGYVRPNYVTFEPFGVNNRSRLPREPKAYLDNAAPPLPAERQVGNTFWPMALWATLYYAAAFLLRPAFRRDLHHRPLAVREALPWLVSPLRKWMYKLAERGVERRLAGLQSKRYFLVPLQVHVDAQVRVHSSFGSVYAFIESVVASFAAHAAPEDLLVIKHHPLDRGYHDYGDLILQLTGSYGLQGRLLYVHDQHLPTLLANARGVVLINSTVGLSALHHGTPLKVVGEALYDLPGLTAQCTLDAFWRAPEQWVRDPALYQAFLAHVVAKTQVNGSFYRAGLFESSPTPSTSVLTDDKDLLSEAPLQLEPERPDR